MVSWWHWPHRQIFSKKFNFLDDARYQMLRYIGRYVIKWICCCFEFSIEHSIEWIVCGWSSWESRTFWFGSEAAHNIVSQIRSTYILHIHRLDEYSSEKIWCMDSYGVYGPSKMKFMKNESEKKPAETNLQCSQYLCVIGGGSLWIYRILWNISKIIRPMKLIRLLEMLFWLWPELQRRVTIRCCCCLDTDAPTTIYHTAHTHTHTTYVHVHVADSIAYFACLCLAMRHLTLFTVCNYKLIYFHIDVAIIHGWSLGTQRSHRNRLGFNHEMARQNM